MREGFRWWIADLVHRHIPRQCWSDLVGWAMRDPRDKGWGFLASLPWRPITKACRDDAARAGRCYCGTVGTDGTVLRYGETVCVTPVPGGGRAMCSRPDGHDGFHRCGGIEWGGVR